MPIYALDDLVPLLPPEGRFWVAPDAQVIGQVQLGEDAGIWFGAVLRGDINSIVIGEGTNIQDLAVIHLADDYGVTIGRYTTIGHSAIIHACDIGDECLIGMGATILDGAKIGDHCIVGPYIHGLRLFLLHSY